MQGSRGFSDVCRVACRLPPHGAVTSFARAAVVAGFNARIASGSYFLCSDAYGYAAWDLAALNSWLESEGGHAEYHAKMHGLWLENTPPEEREEFPFEELSLATFERGSTAPFFKYFAVSPCYFSRDQPSDRLAGQKFDRR